MAFGAMHHAPEVAGRCPVRLGSFPFEEIQGDTKMKKFLWLVASVALTFALAFSFTACGGDDGDGNDNGGTEVNSEWKESADELELETGTQLQDSFGSAYGGLVQIKGMFYSNDTVTTNDKGSFKYIVVEFADKETADCHLVLDDDWTEDTRKQIKMDKNKKLYYVDTSKLTWWASTTYFHIALLSWNGEFKSGDKIWLAIDKPDGQELTP
jgi:hypothetical protein